MTAQNPITDLLAAPLGPEWTVDRLAEEVLVAIAEKTPDEMREFVLDGETTTDRQFRRLLRPLLACLATKSATETGTPTNIYGGRISFKRPGQNGSVWIIGQFENTPGTVRVAFSRSTSPPRSSEPTAGQITIIPETSTRPAPPANKAGDSGPDQELATAEETKKRLAEDKHRRAVAWAAIYVKAAPVGYLATAMLPGAAVPVAATFPLSSNTARMCYGIGKIYRDNWTPSDAATLVSLLNLPDDRKSSTVGTLLSFLTTAPFVGAILGGIAANIVGLEEKLTFAARLIIDHFDSEIG